MGKTCFVTYIRAKDTFPSYETMFSKYDGFVAGAIVAFAIVQIAPLPTVTAEEDSWNLAGNTTIMDAVKYDNTFSTLKQVISRTGLRDTLSSPEANLTLLAPTNSAFEILDEELVDAGFPKIEKMNSDDLLKIMKYHIIPGVKNTSEIEDGAVVETLLESEDKNEVFGVVLGMTD